VPALPTIQAFVTIILAIIPGATFVWGMERVTGAWWVDAGERIIRFLAISFLVQVALSPVWYNLYRHYILTKRLQSGELPSWIWLC
jgi:hypothetical protein